MKTKKAPTAGVPHPIVLGVRYCLGCRRLVMVSPLELTEGVYAKHVGHSLSGCCSSPTALLLLPVEATEAAGRQIVPRVLAELPSIEELGLTSAKAERDG